MDEQAYARATRAFETGEDQGQFLTFSTPDQLFAVLPPKRWVLIERLQADGPLTLRGLARAVGRDVKRVHEDVAALIAERIVEWNDEKKLVVPFATIRFEALIGRRSVA